MKLFDLHCDTAYEMYMQNQGLCNNKLHISTDRALNLESYIQVMAIWCNNKRSDEECFEDFLAIHSNFLRYASFYTGNAPSNRCFYLSVEDARLLCGKIERLDILYDMGVRFLIPMWSGESCIGGAFDTDAGLTDFGKDVIKRCLELGIIPDISHASKKSSDEIFEIAEKARKSVIASHSCAYSQYGHSRNLRDEQFLRIKELGGIVGLSFCSYHLSPENIKCDMENIICHIGHYISLGGENILCLGADMDGAPMPKDITGIESIPKLYDLLCDCFDKEIADKITYKNALNFVNTNF